MNIFMLDKSPQKSAEMLDSTRVIKMIVESAQLLSTAHRILDGTKLLDYTTGRKKTLWKLPDSRDDILYQAAYVNHPCNIWIRKTSSNYRWLFDHFSSLLSEYTRRYGKIHSSSRLETALSSYPNNLIHGDFTPPPLAMPDEYKTEDFVESYRSYFNGEKLFPKKKPADWKTREIPYWVNKRKLFEEVQY